MKTWIAFLVAPAVLVGCGLVEPKSTDPEANQAPNTILTTSPLEGTATTYLAPIAWRGEDSDGIVLGFNVELDGEEWYTTAAGSLFTFSSASGTGDSLSEAHTLTVAAVDDDGAVDGSPPSVSFTSWTYLPETFVAGVDSGAEVGPAVSFDLSAVDPDDYIFTYSYGIDGDWIDEDNDGEPDWFGPSDGVYQAVFADPEIVAGAHPPLTPGLHTFSVKARDRALGIDFSPASLDFTVLDGTEPETWVVGGTVGGEAMAIDGSIYSDPSGLNRVEITVGGDASAYTGTVARYSYSFDGGDYSPWVQSTLVLLTGVQAGAHTLMVRAQDTAGNVDSTPAQLDLQLLLPDLTDDLAVVHETRDGRGVVGSPTAQEVDDFYQNAMGAVPFTVVYWDTLRQVTPAQAGNASTILWHSDDYDSSYISTGEAFLAQYLDAGEVYGLAEKPKLLLSGFNLLASFVPTFVTTDTMTFADGDFVYDYWGIESAFSTYNGGELYTAVAAQEGYPDLPVDGSKLSPLWRGHLRYIWLLDPLDDEDVLYTLASEDGTSAYEGLPCAILHRGDYANYLILTFPLFFMDETAVGQFLEKALGDLDS
jgi:hypothetical protein